MKEKKKLTVFFSGEVAEEVGGRATLSSERVRSRAISDVVALVLRDLVESTVGSVEEDIFIVAKIFLSV